MRQHTYIVDTRRRAGAARLRCRWQWTAALIVGLLSLLAQGRYLDYGKPGSF